MRSPGSASGEGIADRSDVSPAGYTKSFALRTEDKFIVVYGWPDSLLGRVIHVPPAAAFDVFVDHAHLDDQLCAEVIPQ
jgi:hypothetical protein